jgi:adenylate cyclase
MTEERAKRKLLAILSADVKGYSRLMGENELATVETLKSYREVISCLVQQYSGRVVDSPGDNILAEFGSVVDAVECATKIQEDLKEKNASLADNRRMEFRIGINLGDVIEDEGRVYGDGVNVAARIEGLAQGGGTCISGIVFDSVRNKLNLGYEYLGEHHVKNISEPIRAYNVLTEPEAAGRVIGERPRPRDWRLAVAGVALIVVLASLATWKFYLQPDVEPASVEKMAFPLPEKPSIAVLPFVNMSGAPEEENFVDGLTEQIISSLSTNGRLFVIARNSSFKYKGKTVDAREVGRELGVRYIMEGSVRREGQRVRVTAQLIEAATGNHLFSERYDRELKEIFATQDEITIAVLRALRVALTSGEQARLIGRGTKNLDAYLKAIQANEQFLQMDRQGSVKAKEFAQEAIALDPKYAFPYAVLANAHMLDVWFRFSESPEESMKLADEAAHKALELDETDFLTQIALRNLYVMQRKHDEAIACAERALELGPGAARAQHAMGIALYFACIFNEAIPFFEEPIRLDPYPPSTSFRALGTAYGAVGRNKEALKLLEKSLQTNPNDIFAHLSLAALLMELDREEEARAETREVLRLHPMFSLDHFAKTLTFKDQAFVDRRKDLLRKAGLK